MRLMAVVLLLSGVISSAATVTWTQFSNDGSWKHTAGFTDIKLDPVSGKIIVPGDTVTIGAIFQQVLVACDPLHTNFHCVLMNGPQRLTTGCSVADSTMWGNVHFYRQQWIDLLLNRWFMLGGANDSCNGGSPPNDNPRRQMYYFTLNSDPTLDTDITRVIPTTFPQSLVESAVVHYPPGDLYFHYGNGYGTNAYDVYCKGASLTAAQIAAGCTTNNDWNTFTPSNGTVDTVNSGGNTNVTWASGDTFTSATFAVGDYITPDTSNFFPIAAISDSTQMVVTGNMGTHFGYSWRLVPLAITSVLLKYHPGTELIFMYGGTDQNNGNSQNKTYAYYVQEKRWRRKALTGITPIAEFGSGSLRQPPVALDAVGGKLYFHLSTGPSAPKDYVYTVATDSWAELTSAGVSVTAVNGMLMEYVPACNCLIAYSGSTGNDPVIYKGVISEPGAGTVGSSISGRSTLSGAGTLR